MVQARDPRGPRAVLSGCLRPFFADYAVLAALTSDAHSWNRSDAEKVPDEMGAGCDFILFKAGGSSLEVVSRGTSEVLKAVILHPGEASVPEPVFRGIARSLGFYRGRIATVAASRGWLRIGRTEFRHPNISVLATGTGQDIVGTKPAKLQNL